MVDEKTAKRGLALVFTTLLLDVIGIGIIMPVLPTFLQELTGASVSEAAVEGGWLFFVYAAMQFLFAPLIGNLSDRFGRRPVLLASVFTFAIDNLICAVAWSYCDPVRRAACSPASAAPATRPLPPTSPTSAPTRTGRRISACSASPSASASSSARCLAACLANSGRGCRSMARPLLALLNFVVGSSSCRKRWKQHHRRASTGAAQIRSAP